MALGILTPFRSRSLGPLILDAVLEESIGHSAAITEHPIEVASLQGVARGTVADHIYLEPTTYTMRGLISDIPLPKNVANVPFSANSRSASAYQILVRHFQTREPFDVQTKLALLKNMVIETFQFPRDVRTGRALVFTAELREIQMVVAQEIARAKAPEDVSGEQPETQAVSEVNSGEVATQEPEQSFGVKALEAFGF